VTEGVLTGRDDSHLAVAVPKMRAYINQGDALGAQLQFTYLGPTRTQSALGSGAIRVQFGLKLRAADPCNLVYVMWRVEPESKLVVSVKSNPQVHTSSQCGNRGYQNIKPATARAAPAVRSGQSHTLRASLRNNELLAYIDNELVWQGGLSPQAAAMNGPAGIRSDNAQLEFELRAEPATPGGTGQIPGCRTGPDQSE
jgi:hypothetical protein